MIRPSDYNIELGNAALTTYGPTVFQDEERFMAFYRNHIAELGKSYYCGKHNGQLVHALP